VCCVVKFCVKINFYFTLKKRNERIEKRLFNIM
jgi:hypothetical protein